MDRKEVSDDFAQAYFQNVYGSKERLPMNTNVFPPIVDERSIGINKMTVMKIMFVMWDQIQEIYGDDMKEFGLVIGTIVTHYDMNYSYFDMFTNETLGVHTIQDYADFMFNILTVLSPHRYASSSMTPVQFVQQGLNLTPEIAWNPNTNNPIQNVQKIGGEEGLDTQIRDVTKAKNPMRLDIAIEDYLELIGIDIEEGKSLDEMFLNNPEDVNDPEIEATLSNMLGRLRAGDVQFMKKAFKDHLRHQYPVSVQFRKGSKKKGKSGSVVAVIVTKNQTVTAVDLENIDFKGGIDGVTQIDHTTINDDLRRARVATQLVENIMSERETLIVISEDVIGTTESVQAGITELKEIIDDLILVEDDGTGERDVDSHLGNLKNVNDIDISEHIPEEFRLLIQLSRNKIVTEKLERVNLEMLKKLGLNKPSSSVALNYDLAGEFTQIGGFFNLANLWAKTAKDTVDEPVLPPWGIIIDAFRDHDSSSFENLRDNMAAFIKEVFRKSLSFEESYRFVATWLRPNFMPPAIPRKLEGLSPNGVISLWNNVIHSDLGRYSHAQLIKSYHTFGDAVVDAHNAESSELAGQISMRYHVKWFAITILWFISTCNVKGDGWFKGSRRALGYASMAALLFFYLEHSIIFAIISGTYIYKTGQNEKAEEEAAQVEANGELLRRKIAELERKLNRMERIMENSYVQCDNQK